ncbi:MAG: response regulator [Anaerolineae bacterium]|nr:response regulator [Anaerolineae bacterium]
MVRAPHRVLVADDDEDILFLWRNALLMPVGAYEVVTVCDGCDALEEIARMPFDLVVTDIRMPRMDGLELTKAIRQLGYKIPVLWITARIVVDMAEDAKRLGVYCCLYKPLRVAEMRRVVADALAASQKEATP